MRLVIILIMLILVVALVRALTGNDKPEEPRRLENKHKDDKDVIEQPGIGQSHDDDR